MMVHSIEFYEEEKQMEAGKSGVAGGKELSKPSIR